VIDEHGLRADGGYAFSAGAVDVAVRAEEDGASTIDEIEASAVEKRAGGTGGAANDDAVGAGCSAATYIDRREVEVILHAADDIRIDEGAFFAGTASGDVVERAVGAETESCCGVELQNVDTVVPGAEGEPPVAGAVDEGGGVDGIEACGAACGGAAGGDDLAGVDPGAAGAGADGERDDGFGATVGSGYGWVGVDGDGIVLIVDSVGVHDAGRPDVGAAACACGVFGGPPTEVGVDVAVGDCGEGRHISGTGEGVVGAVEPEGAGGVLNHVGVVDEDAGAGDGEWGGVSCCASVS